MRTRILAALVAVSCSLELLCVPLRVAATDTYRVLLAIETDNESQSEVGDMSGVSQTIAEDGSYRISITFGDSVSQISYLAVATELDAETFADYVTITVDSIKTVWYSGQETELTYAETPSENAYTVLEDGTISLRIWDSDEEDPVQDLSGDDDPDTAEYDFSNSDVLLSGDQLIVNITISGIDEALAATGLKGDVNQDGVIDITDAEMALQDYALQAGGGESALTDTEFALADVNEDGVLDIDDASAILQYYAILAGGGTPSWDEILA